MLEWLKWRIAEKEMLELERRRVLMNKYRQWLAEFPDVALALDNMQAEIDGKQLCASHPPSAEGFWDVPGLREVLRKRRHGHA